MAAHDTHDALQIQELHEVVRHRLHTHEQRMTPIRQRLVEILARADRPLTIPEVLGNRRGLAQSSVYRNLVVLEQADVVRRGVTHDEFARFELAEDLTEHHHHLICVSCGQVEDFTASPSLERSLHKVVEEVAGGSGFTALHHRLDLIGTCRTCA